MDRPYLRWVLISAASWPISVLMGNLLTLQLFGHLYRVIPIIHLERQISTDAFVAGISSALFGLGMAAIQRAELGRCISLPRWWLWLDVVSWAWSCAVAVPLPFVRDLADPRNTAVMMAQWAVIGSMRGLVLWLTMHRRGRLAWRTLSVVVGWVAGWSLFAACANPVAHRTYEFVAWIWRQNNEGIFNVSFWFVGYPLTGLLSGLVVGAITARAYFE
jgi:hypothetical protein